MSNTVSSDFDTPWKMILEKYFQLLLEFLFPHIAQDIEWNKPLVHLDKELLSIQKKSKSGKRIADKLIQVFKKNGEKTWIIIHIEIQGSKEKHFSERLFEYYYRIHDRYKMPIVTLAILTDDNAHWRPFQYEQNIWGCHLNFKFPIVKLIDFRARQEILSKSKNIIAKVIEAHLIALNTHKNAELKFQNKLKLVKNLYLLGYNGNDIRALYEFIDYVISLPTYLDEKFIDEMHKYEEVTNMGYITSAERIGMKRGMEKGIEQGIEQGFGLAKKTFLFILQNKYFPSNVPEKVTEKIQNATHQELQHWLKEILDEKFQIEDFV